MIKAPLQSATHWATSQMLNLLQVHGFIISAKKSALVPSTRITQLGVEIDTSVLRICPSLERFQKIQEFIFLFHSHSISTTPLCFQLLELLVLCLRIILWHNHASEVFTLKCGTTPWFHHRCSDSYVGQPLTVSAKVCPCAFLTTDASLEGWGVHLDTQTAQCLWSQVKEAHSINLLELRAVKVAL